MLNKGQTLSDYWRLVNHYDGCVWLQSRATLVCNGKSLDDQHIVVINYVIRYTSSAAFKLFGKQCGAVPSHKFFDINVQKLTMNSVFRGVARNLIWVGINASRRQNNHIKNFKVD